MMNRRQLMGAGIGAGAAALTVNMGQAQTRFRDLPEAASTDSPYTQVPPRPTTGLEYNPIVTLNGWSLPYRMNGNVKEFHLVAEPVERIMADGMVARLWGYNGQSTGPTIEAIEGERGLQFFPCGERMQVLYPLDIMQPYRQLDRGHLQLRGNL